MSAPIKYQTIEHNGEPAFVLVPVDEFETIRSLLERESIKNGVPHNIVEAHVLHGTPMVKAWREHLGLTQEELAEACGMAQASIARIERGDSTTRHATLVRLAAAMDLDIEQLDV